MRSILFLILGLSFLCAVMLAIQVQILNLTMLSLVNSMPQVVHHASTTSAAPVASPAPGKSVQLKPAINTSNWQRYWNKKYNFGFSYPADHTLYSGVDTTSKTLIAATPMSDSVSIAEDESKFFSGTTPVLRMSVINED